MDEEEEPPGCGLSWCGSGAVGVWDGTEVGGGTGPKCVQIFRVGEIVDHGICAKHSGVVLGETRLAF